MKANQDYNLSENQREALIGFYGKIKPLIDKPSVGFGLEFAIKASLVDFVSHYLSVGALILKNRRLAIEAMINCHQNKTKLESKHFNETQLLVLQGIYDHMVDVSKQVESFEINQKSKKVMTGFLVSTIAKFYFKEHVGLLKEDGAVKFVIDYHQREVG